MTGQPITETERLAAERGLIKYECPHCRDKFGALTFWAKKEGGTRCPCCGVPTGFTITPEGTLKPIKPPFASSTCSPEELAALGMRAEPDGKFLIDYGGTAEVELPKTVHIRYASAIEGNGVSADIEMRQREPVTGFTGSISGPTTTAQLNDFASGTTFSPTGEEFCIDESVLKTLDQEYLSTWADVRFPWWENPPLCINCKRYRMDNPLEHRCVGMIEIVTGEIYDADCDVARSGNGLCGVEGRLFDPKDQSE